MKQMDTPVRDLSQDNFIRVLAKDHYPYLGLEEPTKWTQDNKPLRLIWYDSIQATLALYWSDRLDIKYKDLKDIIQSVDAESEARRDDYPCGLVATIVLPVRSFYELKQIDSELFNAKDLLGLVFYGNFVVNLDKLEGYVEDAES
jgi:hypothetical protein